MLSEKKLGEMKKTNLGIFFPVANCRFKPPEILNICCYEMRLLRTLCICGRGSAPDPSEGAYGALSQGRI